MKVLDKVSFYIDTEFYIGIIEKIENGLADIKTDIGLIMNVPINEIKNESRSN